MTAELDEALALLQLWVLTDTADGTICMSLGLYNRIEEALAQPPDAKPVATLICPKCGVDRFKSPCGNASHIMTCPLQGVALAAPQPPAGKGEGQLSCGHPVSLMRKSAETGEDLFCELCDCRSARSDAEAMETKYKAERDAFQALLQEGADGFGRILIATGDDKAVYDWTKRVRAALKGKSIVAAAIPREIHERLIAEKDARIGELQEKLAVLLAYSLKHETAPATPAPTSEVPGR
jgi:hypothetical protein